MLKIFIYLLSQISFYPPVLIALITKNLIEHNLCYVDTKYTKSGCQYNYLLQTSFVFIFRCTLFPVIKNSNFGAMYRNVIFAFCVAGSILVCHCLSFPISSSSLIFLAYYQAASSASLSFLWSYICYILQVCRFIRQHIKLVHIDFHLDAIQQFHQLSCWETTSIDISLTLEISAPRVD